MRHRFSRKQATKSLLRLTDQTRIPRRYRSVPPRITFICESRADLTAARQPASASNSEGSTTTRSYARVRTDTMAVSSLRHRKVAFPTKDVTCIESGSTISSIEFACSMISITESMYSSGTWLASASERSVKSTRSNDGLCANGIAAIYSASPTTRLARRAFDQIEI
jgi:hypothetical protein